MAHSIIQHRGNVSFPILAGILLCLMTQPGAHAQLKMVSPDAGLRMNQIQVIGTHNSYHVQPPESTMKLVEKVTSEAEAWEYSHAPLDVQLDRGVRSFELDIHFSEGGFAVLHVPYLDYRSTCEKLVQCLETVKAWSEAHPRHVPISFLLEGKDEGYVLDPVNIKPLNAQALDLLDAEIRSVFAETQLITPDLVRGGAATLEEAVRGHGWPALDSVRGRVMFILHEQGGVRDQYTAGRPSLEGRAMFIRSREGRPDAAVIIVDGPDIAQIQRLVSLGYMVRTRADAGLSLRNPERRDLAFASGAQIISTDFPLGESETKTGYTVAFEGNSPARFNPVNAMGWIGETALE